MANRRQQEERFIEELFPSGVLEVALQWIQDNLDPIDVFDRDTLIQFAQSQKVDDVFPEKELKEWAEDNGYKLED